MTSVLFLIPSLDRGGAENVLVDLVNHLDPHKFRITVQTLFDQNAQKDRLREGIEYRSFLYHQFHGNSRLLALIPSPLLYRMIVRRRYDVVVSYLEGPTTHIVAGCPYPDSGRAAWVHVEMNRDRQMSVGFRSKHEALKGYRSFDRIAFVAKTVRESFERVAGESFPNGVVLYNTIDSDMILTKALEKLPDHVFSEKECNIVSVGRIIDAKGFDRLAHVQKALKAEGYHTHVYILGTGKDREKLEAYTAENGISDSFTFLGFQENPYPYVANADLFVCSSRREGFSTAVTEALVLGVPVVSTNCSGACELLGDNDEYGVVVDQDEEALLAGIRRLLDEPELLAHYRRQAEIRGKTFRAENTVRAVEEMLTELAGQYHGVS